MHSFDFPLFSLLGNLTAHHQELFYRNPVFSGVRLPECSGRVPLEERFPTVTTTALDLARVLFTLFTDLNVTIQKSWKVLMIHICHLPSEDWHQNSATLSDFFDLNLYISYSLPEPLLDISITFVLLCCLFQSCLQMDPEKRTQCSELLEHPLFTQDSFHIRYLCLC